MKGACAIVADEDRAFLAFAKINGKRVFFISETDIPLNYNGGDICEYLRNGLDVLEKAIADMEQRHSFRVERIFVQLPNDAAQLKTVCDTISLKKRKRIAASDIEFAKKYLQEKFLEWDDHCIHHIPLSYCAEGSSFNRAPLGVWLRKFEMSSLLGWVKEKLYRDLEDTFDAVDRHFGGFIALPVAAFSTAFSQREGIQAVASIDYGRTSLVVSDPKGLRTEKQYDFGLKNIIESLSKDFILDAGLADELFRRHVSFKEIPYFKEITVKKEEAYVNVSTQSLNALVKERIRNQMQAITEQLSGRFPNERVNFSCIGRLGVKEGFFSFIKECLPFEYQMPLLNSIRSSSYGCLQYGLKPFLEDEYRADATLVRRIVKTYRDYF